MGVENMLCEDFDVVPKPLVNGDESTVNTEEDDIMFSGDSSLGDLADEEWPEANQFCFYFVKQLPFDDPEIKAKIDEADHEIYHCNSDRIHIANRLKSKRAERLYLVSKMENLVSSLDEYNVFEEKRREFETLQEDLQVWCLENEFDDQVKKEQEVVKVEINSLSERLRGIKMEIELLDVQMICILEQRDKAFEKIKMLRIQRDKGNATYFQSRAVMSKATELAASGNVRDLEELANSEVEKFMYHWNNEKAFRDDYKKRILLSLDEQQLRCNERIRNSEDKPAETMEGMARAIDETRDDSSSASYQEGNVAIENRKKTKEKKVIKFSSEESDSMDFDITVKLEKEEEEIDEETLKEKKREEQLEKARLAMERKRKLQEKAAAKAAIRVQKEAEKKLKEREKRAKKKKKAAFNSSPSGTSETVTEASEAEKPLLVFPKQRSFRYRRHGKGMEATSLSKVLNKRRKAYKLWIWTVSSAVFALAFLLVIFFYISII